jgi:hypothetical protein
LEQTTRKAEYTSDFINAGLYYRFFRRFGLTFGYQQINSDLNADGAAMQKEQTQNLKIDIVPVLNSKQNQWMAGIDYTIARHAWLTINYGIIGVKNTYSTANIDKDKVSGTGINVIGSNTNLPGYVVANDVANLEPDKTIEIKHEFTQNVLEATINVEF